MKKFLVPFFYLLAGCSSAFATGFNLSSAESVAYSDTYLKGTGGQLSVLLVNSMKSGATLVFSCDKQESLSQVKWYSYTDNVENLTEITSGIETKADSTVLSKPKADCGYAVEYADSEGNKTFSYIWLTKFQPLTAATIDTTKFYCDNLPIKLEPVMTYRTLYGNQTKVKRTEEVSYSVFEMDHGRLVDSKTELLSGDSVLYVPTVPTVDTPFELVNSLFRTSLTTDTFVSYAVNAFPVMTTTQKHIAEIQNGEYKTDENGRVVLYFDEGGAFRTSSPFDIDIKSNCSPKVNEFTWYIARDSSFKNAIPYYNWKEEIIGYSGLNTKGSHCIKLEVSNSKSGCSFSSIACFSIDSSRLYVPNVFTPNGTDNKEFKVGYSSIKSFECRIYNQWGRKVFDTSDINEGWDGTFNGHELPTGAYFCVIKAEGFDGLRHDKKKTINLIRTKD
ncbi:MAG: gliding motility-associated C-terminal domain-containing protein [Paludibacteraceae bacterium]|nr:gliding motility-associated C-terminal domain-containing protein [Paludibacteraceae bacterium]